jgi:hypothetical protein
MPILGKHTHAVPVCPSFILPLDESSRGSQAPSQPRRHPLTLLYMRTADDNDQAYGTVCRSDCVERCRAVVTDGMSSRTPRYRMKEISVMKALGGQGI